MNFIPGILFFLTLSFACAAQQLKEAEVPPNVSAIAQEQSNNHPITMWVLDKKRSKYIATVIRNTMMLGIEISLDGKWIETTTAVLPDKMPAPVMTALKDYSEYELDNFFYITSPDKSSYYTVDASSDDEDLTISVDPAGKILKKVQR